MGRLRSFLRGAVKPAAMVGTVGLLSLSLIVTTPSTAQALVKPKGDPVATFVMGAAKTVAPVAMAAVSLTPIGWGMRLAQLGFLAYSTSDMWMPFFTGDFGEGTGTGGTPDASGFVDEATTVPLSNNAVPGFPAHSSEYLFRNYQITGQGITFEGYYSGGTNAQNQAVFSNAAALMCKNTGTGAVTRRPWEVNASFHSGARITGFTRSCEAGETLDGVVMGGPSAHPELPTSGGYRGPRNVVTWGTLAQNPDAFDPLGEDTGYQGKSECIDTAGTVSWVTADMFSGDTGAVRMPSCEAAGKGHGTGRTKVEAFKPDGTTETVWDTGASPLSDPATPLCDPGRATSGCVLEVTKDGQPCKTGDVECENWSSESQQEGNTRYGCKLGPYVMPLSACSLLEKAYHPGGSPMNDENTDGNPSTSSPLGPNGQPAPVAAPTVTGTGTGTNPVPGGSGQTGSGADEKTRQCFPTGWGMFNPVEWVVKPLRCVFEPSLDFAAQGNALRTKAMTKAPMSMVSAIAVTAPTSVGGQGACPAWVVHISSSTAFQNSNFSQNVVCESSFIQAIVNARPALFGLISGAMLWPFLRSLWYAMIPVVRVVPTGGK